MNGYMNGKREVGALTEGARPFHVVVGKGCSVVSCLTHRLSMRARCRT